MQNESDGEMSLDRGARGGFAVIRDWEMVEQGMRALKAIVRH
jgi:hypothetical protein